MTARIDQATPTPIASPVNAEETHDNFRARLTKAFQSYPVNRAPAGDDWEVPPRAAIKQTKESQELGNLFKEKKPNLSLFD